MYAAIGTCPDIAYAVQQLSQFAANLTTEHFTAAKCILWYLKATHDLSIVYQTNTADTIPTVTTYLDADWGNHVDDQRSISGHVMLISSGPIRWCAKKQ